MSATLADDTRHAPAGLRHALYLALDPAARTSRGLSLLNLIISASIIGAVVLGVLETEPTIVGGRQWLFDLLETAFGVCFAIEYLARLWTAAENPKYGDGWRGRFRYIMSPAAVFDALAIIVSFATPTGLTPFFLRSVRLLRIFRLAKLGRMTTAMGFLISAIVARRDELLFSLFVGLFFLLLSATCLSLVEGGVQPDKFGSIPRALWWATATLTTIGYGDVYPITPLGKVLAAISAIVGIGLVAMPTGIMAAAFSDAVQKHLKDRLAASWRAELEPLRAMGDIAARQVAQAAAALQPGRGSAKYLAEDYSPELLADAIEALEQAPHHDFGDLDVSKQVAIVTRLATRAKRLLDRMARDVDRRGINADAIATFRELAGRIAAAQQALIARVVALEDL